MSDLFQHSIQVILEGQADSGAYIACPSMPDYAYCWFRDGTFIARAMDLAGQPESARRFHDWAAAVICEREAIVERALEKAARGEPLSESDYLHTRYTLDGQEGEDEWPNFQLDGFGTWLWGMIEHLRQGGDTRFPPIWGQAAELVARYLAGLWRWPNYDCWEEFGDRVHPHTLAALYAGLRSYASFTGRTQYARVAKQIRGHILQHGVRDGHFVKYIGTDAVDASLLGIAVPYGVVPPDDPRFQATLARIEADLRQEGGGLHRYARDTYYGGGEWLLLTAWLGWVYAEIGQPERAEELRAWVAAQATDSGDLPEQVPVHLNDPPYLEWWIERRGPIATPLLWSHAMLLILDVRLGAGRGPA